MNRSEKLPESKGTFQWQRTKSQSDKGTNKPSRKVNSADGVLDNEVNKSASKQIQSKDEVAKNTRESTKEPESNSLCGAESNMNFDKVGNTQELANFDEKPGNSSERETPADYRNSGVGKVIDTNLEEANSSSEYVADIKQGSQNIHQEHFDTNEPERLLHFEEENDSEFEETEEEGAPMINRRCHFGDSDEEISEKDSYTDGDSQTTSEHEVPDSVAVAADRNTSEIHDTNVKKEEVGKKQTNRRDPTFVPREGAFYLHDTRDESGNSSSEAPHQPARKEPNRPGINNAKWSHDLYNENEQCPRSTNEIVSRYGYNIREKGPKHTEDVNPDPAQRRPNNHRRGGRGRYPRHEQNPPKSVAFAEEDFLSLQEVETSKNRGKTRGVRSIPTSGPRKHNRSSVFTFDNRKEATQSRGVSGYSNLQRHSNSRKENASPERTDLQWDDQEDLKTNITVQNPDLHRSGKRYSSNRLQRGNEQLRQVVLKVQPRAQRPYSRPSTNPRGPPRSRQGIKPNPKSVKASKTSDVCAITEGGSNGTVRSAGDFTSKCES